MSVAVFAICAWSTAGQSRARADAAAGGSRFSNVLALGGATTVDFDHGEPAFGMGIGYERALSESIGLSLELAVSSVELDEEAIVGIGVGLPIYLTGTAPSGLFAELGVSTALAEVFNIGFGLALGGQHVLDFGLTLGASAGPVVGIVDGDAVGAFGGGVSIGGAF